MDEADPRVELRVAGKTLFDAWDPDQNQTDAPTVKDVPHLLKPSHFKPNIPDTRSRSWSASQQCVAWPRPRSSTGISVLRQDELDRPCESSLPNPGYRRMSVAHVNVNQWCSCRTFVTM
jgi:hypothetical protein